MRLKRSGNQGKGDFNGVFGKRVFKRGGFEKGALKKGSLQVIFKRLLQRVL